MKHNRKDRENKCVYTRREEHFVFQDVGIVFEPYPFQGNHGTVFGKGDAQHIEHREAEHQQDYRDAGRNKQISYTLLTHEMFILSCLRLFLQERGGPLAKALRGLMRCLLANEHKLKLFRQQI